MEDLHGIRRRVSVRRSQRSRLHSWGFYQLRSFVEYKARLAGVEVVAVPSRGTSHISPVCGTNEKANRPNRDLFRCIGCGYAGPAEHVAAINIAARPMSTGLSSQGVFLSILLTFRDKPPNLLGGS